MADLTATSLLNGICPYFTMFPLEFPLDILRPRARRSDRVLDPFCGRGTTNFASRILGLGSVGIDSSPIAVSVTNAKLIDTRPEEIAREARLILRSRRAPLIPRGEFWERAFHAEVLVELCRLRSNLCHDCSTDARCALRAIILGALHGPKQKSIQSYFSNQCTRTYAPKPAYALKFWRRHKLRPERVNLLEIIQRRANRYYSSPLPKVRGSVFLGDSRRSQLFQVQSSRERFSWVITSPPYYGMRTYIPDQWLRNWFLGGPEAVQYASDGQMEHNSPAAYIEQLRTVWTNAANSCRPGARMVIRFGGIRDRDVDPHDLIKPSLKDSGWRLTTLRTAGTALRGKRQADTFLPEHSKPVTEFDIWAELE
jgi:hypothetical protein